ncbi:MAG: hypothetical protein JPMHGGIA_02713 [Saprospiraceae bacterium]|jgi:hypothetical protein|nr:hypothetical protein [Saprospiraceae bacterium]
MNKTILLILILFKAIACLSQKQDFEWVINHNFLKFKRDSGSGCTKISFNSESGNPNIYFDSINIIEFLRSASCIADKNGEFLFAFNGYHAEDATGDRVINWESIKDDCEPIPQGHLILPIPNKTDQFILFTTDVKWVGGEGVVGVTELSMSILKIKSGKRVEVISGKQQVQLDTFDYGKISACKHANGRDWWVIIPVDRINHFYNILLTPNGIDTIFLQKVDDLYRAADVGFSCFSSNGEFFVIGANMAFNHLSGIGNYIDFYQFDRCNGTLYNHQYRYVDSLQPYGVGVEFSPNNKFLFVASGSSIYQYEILNGLLMTKNIVGNYDGYLSEYLPGKFSSNNFHQLQLAPDGRIYVSNYFSYVKEFHTINKPNNVFKDCDFRKHNVLIPTIKTVMPSFSKFRLGPIDGSICDSLGIDNIPWCHWRYDQDTSDYLKFEFTDLSAYEVEEWCWNFGDPKSISNTSNDKNPTHKFSEKGVYEVCLMVKNRNGMDTLCRNVNIGVMVNTEDNNEIPEIQIWPNPCEDYVIINVMDYNPQKMILKLYDLWGMPIDRKSIYQGSNYMNLKNLPGGVYFAKVTEDGKVINSKRIYKL